MADQRRLTIAGARVSLACSLKLYQSPRETRKPGGLLKHGVLVAACPGRPFQDGSDRLKAIDADTFLRLIRGQTRGPAASLGRLGLELCSAVYGLGAAARNTAYDRGWKTSQRATVPVVSVGNITLGGTGKTPMVEWIARWYRRRGVRVTLISRGYGHAGGINDEGLVLEENLPDVPHLQDPDRLQLASIATTELEAELIILDDGFQHRRLTRDLDLVMLDALDPFGLGKLFPRGLLREPIRSLRRASAVILSRADLLEPSQR
jgi:tetraacyldisaccharide 4'-kinase